MVETVTSSTTSTTSVTESSTNGSSTAASSVAATTAAAGANATTPNWKTTLPDTAANTATEMTTATANGTVASLGGNSTTVSPSSNGENIITAPAQRNGESVEKLRFIPHLQATLTLELCGSCSRTYVGFSVDKEHGFFAGEACCTPVPVEVTARLDLSDGDNVMRVVAFNASKNFTCDAVTLVRRGGAAISEELRDELSEAVSAKVKSEVLRALEVTYKAIFEDELRDTFPRVDDLLHIGQGNSGAAAAVTSSGSSF